MYKRLKFSLIFLFGASYLKIEKGKKSENRGRKIKIVIWNVVWYFADSLILNQNSVPT